MSVQNNFSVKGVTSVVCGLAAGLTSGVFCVSKIIRSMPEASSSAKSLKAVGWALGASVGSIALAGAVGYAVYNYFPSNKQGS